MYIYILSRQAIKNRILNRLLQVRGFKHSDDEKETAQHFVSKGKNGIYSINRKIFFPLEEEQIGRHMLF